MGLEKHTEMEFTCDNCGKDLLKQKTVIYSDVEFSHSKYYFCSKKCEKEFYNDQIYSTEKQVQDIINDWSI